MKQTSSAVKILIPLLILLLAATVAFVLIRTKQAPKKEIPDNPGVLVQVMTVEKQDYALRIPATGTVQARQETTITPQISGRIVEISPKMVAGGFFRKNERMFAIEAIDFELAVEQAEATMSKAGLELETAKAQASIARQEWDRLKRDDEEPNPLVLYEPQLKTAEANLASARANLDKARLNLQRTRILAPFDCYVRSENVDLGQYVKSGNSVAALAGTDRAEIIVPLPLEEVKWLQIPRPSNRSAGSLAEVSLMVGEHRYSWPGQVVRTLGEVDARGRMSRLVIEVKDPYGLQEDVAELRPELMVGTFVEVSLLGETLENVAAVPRGALREGDTLWLVDQQDMLKTKSITVLRRERDTILVNGSLDGGERVVLTNISGAADGMKLRPVAAEVRE
jgi:RND family efflux transporter MFP subunit